MRRMTLNAQIFLSSSDNLNPTSFISACSWEEAIEKGWDFYHEVGGDALENLEWDVDSLSVSEAK
mgnify:CR=1 FL=1